jgi:hypothetical protein
MTTPPPPFNPSQTVERIREIIVGRQLDRLEERVSRLEIPGSPTAPGEIEDRLIATEARVEALQESVHRIADSVREETQRRNYLQHEEVQRLAAQIQQVAATHPQAPNNPSISQLEQKLGRWLTDWQGSFHRHLEGREQQLAFKLRDELAQLRAWTETRIATLEAQMPDTHAINERFNRIAAAAQALADCAKTQTIPSTPAFPS